MTSLPTPSQPFGDLLAARVSARESQLVLGLDPDPVALWPSEGTSGPSEGTSGPSEGTSGPSEGTSGPSEGRSGPSEGTSGPSEGTSGPSEGRSGESSGTAAERAAHAVLGHCRAVIDAVAPACVAVKLQLACFERLGGAGWRTLEMVGAHAHERGLLVIADGKRGDIPVTAEVYAEALTTGGPSPFGMTAGLNADLVTVNPLMGRETIEPFLRAARASGAGVLVLVRTSNPGASDLQDLRLRGGGALWERIAGIVEELACERVGTAGLGDVGAVIGATEPIHLERARELMPHAFFLIPGVGSQGGRVEDLGAAFAVGRAGGLITASRAIVGAHRSAGGEPAHAARAEAERLRALGWALSSAGTGPPATAG